MTGYKLVDMIKVDKEFQIINDRTGIIYKVIHIDYEINRLSIQVIIGKDNYLEDWEILKTLKEFQQGKYIYV